MRCHEISNAPNPSDDTRVPRALPERLRNLDCNSSSLSRALQLDDREELRVIGEGDDELQLGARPGSGWGLWACAPRVLRPLGSRLVAGSSVRGPSAFVDLGGRLASEARVGPMLVVPADVERDRAAKGLLAERHSNPPKPLGLHGPKEALDRRGGSDGVLARVPGGDAAPGAPLRMGCGGKLRSEIGDEVLRRLTGGVDGASEEASDLGAVRLLREGGEAHDALRVLVDDERDPPGEGEELDQGLGHPGDPEAVPSGDDGEVHHPGVIGFRRDEPGRGRRRVARRRLRVGSSAGVARSIGPGTARRR